MNVLSEFALSEFALREFAMSEFEMSNFAMSEIVVSEFALSECAMERRKSQVGRPTRPLLNALLPSNMISSSLHYDRDDRGVSG